jgi:hypothetical protein
VDEVEEQVDGTSLNDEQPVPNSEESDKQSGGARGQGKKKNKKPTKGWCIIIFANLILFHNNFFNLLFKYT